MLANVWLKQHRHALTEWPTDLTSRVSPLRPAYIAAIKLAVNDNDMRAIMALHRQLTPQS